MGQPVFRLQEVKTVEDKAKSVNKQSKKSIFFIANSIILNVFQTRA